jgi:iron complex outermembrane receptor protein
MRRLIVLALLLLAPIARADDRADAKAHFDQGVLYYNVGKFQEALDEYSKAYEIFRAPELLFNIGQCYKQLGNHERALFHFRSYLREVPESPNRAVVEDLIGESERELDKQKQAERLREEAEQRRKVEEARRQREEEERRRLAEQRRLTEAEVQRESVPVWKKWWFWTAVGGVAVSAIVGGTIYYFSGDTTIVPPEGTLGVADGRGGQ